MQIVQPTGIAWDGIVFAEGLRWHGGRLWISDVLGARVYSAIPGDEKHLELELPTRPSGLGFTPDGICVDAEHHVWVSCFGTHEFLRVAPSGEITTRVRLPDGRRAVSCALGGADRRTLYLATAETTLDDLTAGRASARIDYVTVEVPGAGWP